VAAESFGGTIVTVHVHHIDSPEGEDFAAMRRLKHRVYADDPHYCLPFDGTEQREFERDRFRNRQRLLVAEDDNGLLAHVLARVATEHRDESGAPLGMLGQFEALDLPDAVHELLTAACAWLKSQGCHTVAGPIDGDTWHEYRFNLGPFDEPPFLKEPHNPAYYPDHWEAFGFRTWQTYHSRRVPDIDAARDGMAQKWRSVRDRGFRFDGIDVDQFEHYLERLYAIVPEIFRDNFLYSDITRDEFMALYDGTETLVDSDLAFILVAPDGRDAGFSFTFPDVARAVASMDGKKSVWAKAKYLLHSRTEVGNVKTVGIMPDFQGQGLYTAMTYQFYEGMLGKGLTEANLCLMSDGNISASADGGDGQVLRRYAIYRLELDEEI
jgi:GNAT superfamily N-acetyltransferase